MLFRSSGSGQQEVKVDFNSAPRMVALTSSQSRLDVGQQTALGVSATDADGDALSYQWGATCAGGFTGMDSPRATFTASALPAAACNNCQVSVVVTDGRGGRNTGRLELCLSGDVPWKTHGSWDPTASMSTSRGEAQAVQLASGRVLVMGGFSSGFTGMATAEVYDPATGTWSPTGSMSTRRVRHEATRLADGRVLVSSNGKIGRAHV